MEKILVDVTKNDIELNSNSTKYFFDNKTEPD